MTVQEVAQVEAGEISVKHRPLSGRKKCCICTGATIAVLVVLIIVVIILIFTLFKPKDPRIIINSVNLQDFNASFNLPVLQPSLTLILALNITVKNPNRAGFQYGNGTSYLYYHGEEVGEALIPSGSISAMGTENLLTSINIQADHFLANSNLSSDINVGLLPVTSQTSLSGRVKIINIIKRHANAITTCDVNVSVASRNISDFHCSYKVKL